jgi:predicted nucleic acid-binding protein
MRVYVESNFILEMALLQEHHTSCEAILALAEEGGVTLVFPAFSVAEPYHTFHRRQKDRQDLQARLLSEFTQIGRSKPYEEAARNSSEVVALLAKSGEEYRSLLERVMARILRCAVIVPIDAHIHAEALTVQSDMGLEPPDAIIYASLRRDMASHPDVAKCFLNSNSKDFLVPEIANELASLNCVLIPQFANGLAYMQRGR